MDVGSGAGVTLKWLKQIFPNAHTTALEINGSLINELKLNADTVVIGSLTDNLSMLEKFDLILLLDVLEHLVDPKDALTRLLKHLEPGGHIIVSVPNIAHLQISVPLLFKRHFEYQDAGILDRTHLRFFVKETIVQLLNEANFFVVIGLVSGLQPRRWKWLNRLSFGFLRDHLTSQYILLARPMHDRIVQTAISWKISK